MEKFINKFIRKEIHETILREAYELDLAKKVTSILKTPEAKKRTEKIMNNILYQNMNSFKSKRGDRIYVPFKTKDSFVGDYVSTTHKAVDDALKNTEFKLKDYLKGYATDKFNREVKIGQVLKRLGNDDLLKRFSDDKTRSGRKVIDGGYVVFSTHPYDIAGASTGRGWTSCMKLKDGPNEYISCNIEEGAIVAYFIKPDDLNINNPISRIFIKPFVNYYDSNDILYSTKADKIYGDNIQAFHQTVDSIIAKAQEISYDEMRGAKTYSLGGGFYVDERSTFSLGIGYLIAHDKMDEKRKNEYLNTPERLGPDDIKEILIYKPEYIKKLSSVLETLNGYDVSEILKKQEQLLPYLIDVIDKKFNSFTDYKEILMTNPELIHDLDLEKIRNLGKQTDPWGVRSLLFEVPELSIYFYDLLGDDITKEIGINVITKKPELFDKISTMIDVVDLSYRKIMEVLRKQPSLFKHYREKMFGLSDYMLDSAIEEDPNNLTQYINVLEKEENVSAEQWAKVWYVFKGMADKKPNIVYRFKNHLDGIRKKRMENYDYTWETDLAEIMRRAPETIEFFHKENQLQYLTSRSIPRILKKSPEKIKYFINKIKKMPTYELNFLLEDIPEISTKYFKDEIENFDSYDLMSFLNARPNEVENFKNQIKEKINITQYKAETLNSIIKKNPMAIYYFFGSMVDGFLGKDDLTLIFNGATKAFNVFLKTMEKKMNSSDYNKYDFQRLLISSIEYKPKQTLKIIGNKIKAEIEKNPYTGISTLFNDNPRLREFL